MLRGLVVAVALVGLGATNHGQAVDAEAVPTWLSWRVFHDAVTFSTRDGSFTAVEQQFGLTAPEATRLRDTGASYSAALDRIDVDARAALRAQVSKPLKAPRNPKRRLPAFPPGTIIHDRSKSLRTLALESGLYAEVESKKVAAFAKHMTAILRAIPPEKLVVISDWIRTDVAPHIRIAETGIPVPNSDRTSKQ